MELLNAQAAQIAKAIAEQAAITETAMIAQGTALVEQIAAQAMAQAAANAAGAMALRAQELLSEMASTASRQLNDLEALEPVQIDARVIDLKPVPIALPSAARAVLPASQRMLNANASIPSKSAKRRARRSATADQTSTDAQG